ncbi:MAG: SpoIIIAH-like family protein [Lachnospiraceae bacterium]|nr:SpoIIIAH-like family protein [Lachnospiraceae bacterium]
MFTIKRNHIIVTTLMIMIAIAGYLNFSEAKSSERGNETALQSDETLGNYAILGDEEEITTLADDMTEEEIASSEFDPITAEAIGDTGSEAVAASTTSADDTGAAVFVNSTLDASEYFVQAKLDREQERAKEKDILTEMINNKNVEKEQKVNCAESMLELQKRIEKEAAAEAMIKAKGFKEAYVRIDDNTVDVVIDKESLTEAETAQIMDIVKRKTGIANDKIRITIYKKQQ